MTKVALAWGNLGINTSDIYCTGYSGMSERDHVSCTGRVIPHIGPAVGAHSRDIDVVFI